MKSSASVGTNFETIAVFEEIRNTFQKVNQFKSKEFKPNPKTGNIMLQNTSKVFVFFKNGICM